VGPEHHRRGRGRQSRTGPLPVRRRGQALHVRAPSRPEPRRPLRHRHGSHGVPATAAREHDTHLHATRLTLDDSGRGRRTIVDPTRVPAHLTPRRLADACEGCREGRRVIARHSDTVSPVPLVGPPVQHHLHPADLLAVGLKSAPDDVALLSNRRRVTWRELDDESRLLAAGYRQFGLSPGDRVASLMPNCIDLVVHYLACLRAGLVATPLNYRYTHREIDHALDVC